MCRSPLARPPTVVNNTKAVGRYGWVSNTQDCPGPADTCWIRNLTIRSVDRNPTAQNSCRSRKFCIALTNKGQLSHTGTPSLRLALAKLFTALARQISSEEQEVKQGGKPCARIAPVVTATHHCILHCCTPVLHANTLNRIQPHSQWRKTPKCQQISILSGSCFHSHDSAAKVWRTSQGTLHPPSIIPSTYAVLLCICNVMQTMQAKPITISTDRSRHIVKERHTKTKLKCEKH